MRLCRRISKRANLFFLMRKYHRHVQFSSVPFMLHRILHGEYEQKELRNAFIHCQIWFSIAFSISAILLASLSRAIIFLGFTCRERHGTYLLIPTYLHLQSFARYSLPQSLSISHKAQFFLYVGNLPHTFSLSSIILHKYCCQALASR